MKNYQAVLKKHREDMANIPRQIWPQFFKEENVRPVQNHPGLPAQSPDKALRTIRDRT